ncbi:hypothetical protein GCM10011513_36300 [Franconibacter daqui]|jgi:hypothetical protein|nr:hypothetical protein GCM10011513_36300 [Franconibacter daqui]
MRQGLERKKCRVEDNIARKARRDAFSPRFAYPTRPFSGNIESPFYN